MPTASQEMAGYIASLQFGDIPAEVVSRTADLVLDHLGVCIFGSTTPWAQMVTDQVISEGGKEQSTMFLSGHKTIPRSAALANGVMSHAFELDDTLTPFHPGGVVIPAALAVGEDLHCTGRDFVAAVVAGYEVIGRIGSAIHDAKVIRHGHHATGILGSFGAAAAAGKLLKLDEKKLVSALGLAANQHTGLMEFFKEGTMEKRFFSGKGAHDGVLSAVLAARGFTAASTLLDGEYGFCRVFDREADLSLLTRDLGKTFKLMETTIKPYPCCRTIHAQIDAAIKIAEAQDLSPEDISEVVVGGNAAQACDQHAYYDVPDVMAAQYGIPYCIARALISRNVWVDDFTPAAMTDPETLKFMRCIKVVPDEEVERRRGMAKVSIKSREGETFTETVLVPRGSPGDPSFRKDLHEKFARLSLGVLPEERVNTIRRLVAGLAGLGDIGELAAAVLARP
ncbi:MAG: MmgE/PrpD family protein [Chloroflexi bacterium]|nr:MmgE/PrpD family protein [Chloroflexota bacterium]